MIQFASITKIAQCCVEKLVIVVIRQNREMKCVDGIQIVRVNPLTPNDHYSGRTASLTSKRCILYIYSTNIGTEYFKHGVYSPFFLLKLQFFP
jgi:hypothetical protein